MSPMLLNPFGYGGGGGAYAAAVLSDSPLMYLRLNDASGLPQDSSGNSHNSTAATGGFTRGATGLINGDSDTCFDFTAAGAGSSSPVEVANAAWMDTGVATIECVITADTMSGIRSPIDRDLFGTQRCWQFRINGGKFEFIWWTTVSGAFVLTGATTLVAGSKYHLAATFDGTNGRIYVNGVLDGTLAGAGSLQVGGALISLGCSRSGGGGSPTALFDGRIDEVAYYGTALSGAQIAAHSAAAYGGLTFQQEVLADSPTHFYRLQETSGTVVTDISGNSRHGTYVGSPTLNQAGPKDKAVLFNSGGSKYFTLPTGALPSGSSPYTLAAYVNTAYAGNQGIFGFGSLSDNQANCVTMNAAGNLKNWWFSNDVQTANGVVPSSAWTHVALTFDGTNRRFIVNGTTVSTQASSGKNTVFGQAYFSLDLNGALLTGYGAEVAVFDTAISAARIAAWLAAPA